MKWKKFTIQTTTAAEDFISEKLSEIGIEGIEIEDKVELTANDTKGMFIDGASRSFAQMWQHR